MATSAQSHLTNLSDATFGGRRNCAARLPDHVIYASRSLNGAAEAGPGLDEAASGGRAEKLFHNSLAMIDLDRL